jgi:hypothetical protein
MLFGDYAHDILGPGNPMAPDDHGHHSVFAPHAFDDVENDLILAHDDELTA